MSEKKYRTRKGDNEAVRSAINLLIADADSMAPDDDDPTTGDAREAEVRRGIECLEHAWQRYTARSKPKGPRP